MRRASVHPGRRRNLNRRVILYEHPGLFSYGAYLTLRCSLSDNDRVKSRPRLTETSPSYFSILLPLLFSSLLLPASGLSFHRFAPLTPFYYPLLPSLSITSPPNIHAIIHPLSPDLFQRLAFVTRVYALVPSGTKPSRKVVFQPCAPMPRQKTKLAVPARSTSRIKERLRVP